MNDWGEASHLVAALATYSNARREFLGAVGCRPDSMREPLAEFSELLVASLTGEGMADSPVQQGWDLKATDGTTTQVRYVANPKGPWVNGHEVKFVSGVDRYAIVIYEALEPTCVFILDRETLGQVCALLGKRHPNQATTLQITQENVRRMLANPTPFLNLQVKVFPSVST